MCERELRVRLGTVMQVKCCRGIGTTACCIFRKGNTCKKTIVNKTTQCWSPLTYSIFTLQSVSLDEAMTGINGVNSYILVL